jgi:hypothetical protein
MKDEYLDIEELKGVKILYENDFYEYAKVVIKMKDAYSDYQKQKGNITGKARPTIYGLARNFATTADIYFSDQEVLIILKKYGFSGQEVLDIKDL